MSTPDWKSLITTLAPTIATALGGPLAGLAVQTLSGAVLGTSSGAIEDIAAALADPEKLITLKTAETEFKTRLKELDIKETTLINEDRAGARAMQVETRDLMPAALAGFVFAGFFGILAALIFIAIPESSLSPLNIMLGSLGTIVVQIAAFYFGTSKGSNDKTKIFSGLLDNLKTKFKGDSE